MAQQNARHPPLLPTHTFVVQLRSDAQVEAGQMTGRVEHLISRHAMMFESLDALLAFIAQPTSPTYGKVVHTASVGCRHEAHHAGFTDDRRYLWAGGLDTSQIFVFDIHSDPTTPRLVKTFTDFVAKSGGVVGPHTFYALPGCMLITGLSNDKDHGGRTALVEYTNEGEYITTHWMPTAENPRSAAIATVADGYGYDVRALPRKNIMLTSSFTGWSNYMMDFGKMLQDKEAMQRFGQTMVVWNLHTRQPKKVLHVPGVPLEVRFAWGARNNYAFTTTALTSKIWLIYEDDKGEWQAQAVADIGDPSKVPLPVDSTISADDRLLWVNTFMDGTARAFDISDPFHPTQVYEKRIGSQVNMVSQSWDGKRFYFTSSLLANWDKKVVRFYNRGGHPHPLLDPMIRPLHLTDAEVAALVAFLESLTGDNIAALIADARSVRVGNVTVELPQ